MLYEAGVPMPLIQKRLGHAERPFTRFLNFFNNLIK
nr:hypothetical protein [uncultured Anaerobutyricum sp.]